MLSLPDIFVRRVEQDLGEEQGRALCESLDSQPPTSIRFNPYKMESKPEVQEGQEGQGGQGVPWNRYGVYLENRPQFTYDSDFHAGAYYVQEAGSQFIGHILDGMDIEGYKVLDMCAAPGGKTTLYASLVGLNGLVVANEVDKRRANILADNVRKWGLGNVAVCSNPPKHISDFRCWFDIVAVDAPCSGEGMFRKSQEAREEWSEANVKMCAVRQGEILRESWRSLKLGGLLIYSTCTFNRLENEGVLEDFISWAEDEVVECEDIAIDDNWGVVKGQVGAFQTFRFYPHKSRSEGFFVAVARKTFDTSGRYRTPKSRKVIFGGADRVALKELSKWVMQPKLMTFVSIGDMYYGYYTAQFDTVKSLAESLTVIYSGVAMGQIFKGKLKPDPALALFCDVNIGAVPAVELEERDALLYLSKQDVEVSKFVEGINLVRAKGKNLGFVKRIGNRVNNMYPNSLRIINSASI